MHSESETHPRSPLNYTDFESSDEAPSGAGEAKTQDPSPAEAKRPMGEKKPSNMANTASKKSQDHSPDSERKRNSKRPMNYADKSSNMKNPSASKKTRRRVLLPGRGGRRKNKLTKRKHKNGKKAKKAKKGKNRTKKRKKKHKYTRKNRKHKIKKKK